MLGLIAVALGMGYSMWFRPAVMHFPGWWMNSEVWIPVNAASWVSNGAYPYMYEADRGWIAGPLLPMLLVPIALLRDHLFLTDNQRFNVPHPTLWPIYGSVGMALVTPVFYSARSLVQVTREGRSPREKAILQGALLFLVGVPVAMIYGHFEDLVALALILLAFRELAKGGQGWRGPVFLGLAICAKQWSLLVLPVAWIGLPRPVRPKWAELTLAFPVVLMGIPLVVDPAHAVPALLLGRAFPVTGHAALWESARVVTGTPFRSLEVLVAVFLALMLARRAHTDPAALMAGLTVIFVLRLALEPVVFGYYLSPALAFSALHEYQLDGQVRRTVLIGALMLLLFPLHPPAGLWWAVETGMALILTWPSMRTIQATRRVESRDNLGVD